MPRKEKHIVVARLRSVAPPSRQCAAPARMPALRGTVGSASTPGVEFLDGDAQLTNDLEEERRADFTAVV